VLKKIQPDIVHAHYISHHICWYAALIEVHPYFVSILGDDVALDPELSLMKRQRVIHVLKAADLIHVWDKYCVERVEELVGKGSRDSARARERVFVQPWGVDTAEFTPEARSEPLRAKLGVKPTSHIVICTRVDIKTYNIEVLMNAIPHVIKALPDTKFILIKDERRLEEQVAKLKALGIQRNVILLNYIPHTDISEYIASSDVFVDPLIRDKAGGGIGVGTLEAMSCGVVPVNARRPGMDETLSHYRGVLFDGRNPRELAEKIIGLLKNDDLRASIGAECRKIVRAHFEWEKNISRIDKIYQQI
jgi:phosphatidylinositol alpha-1,6-mannosyltransferase